MSVLTYFRGTTGLNTVVDPQRLKYDKKTGVQELAVAINIDVDDTGRISRRKGCTSRLSIPVHSLWSDGSVCLFVTGTSLCSLDSSLRGYTVLATVMAGARVSYCPVNGAVYWVNGFERGYVQDNSNHAWNAPASAYMPDTTRRYLSPPTGTIVAYYRGRIYVVQGSVAWYSAAFGYSLFELGRAYLPFPEPVLMFRPVENGIWVGTEKATWFLAGDTPEAFSLVKAAAEKPIEGTDVSFHGRLTTDISGTPIVQDDSKELAAMWLTGRGVCYGGGSGDLYFLSEDKLASLPTGITGSGLISAGKYIGLIDP